MSSNVKLRAFGATACLVCASSFVLFSCESAARDSSNLAPPGPPQPSFVSADAAKESYDGDLVATLRGFDVRSNPGNLLLVAVAWGAFEQPARVESVTRGGVALQTAAECLYQNPEQDLGLQLFWLAGASRGDADIVATFSNPGDGQVDQTSIAAMELQGVDAVKPLGDCMGSFAYNADSIAAEAPTGTGDLAVSALYFLDEAQAPVPGSGQLERVKNAGASVSLALSTASAGSSGTQMTWTGVDPGVAMLVTAGVKAKR